MISVVFTCKGRPSLTELCLRRFTELMRVPFELVLVYDGNSIEYVNRLLDIYDFEYIVMNSQGRFYIDLLNDAYGFCTGDYYMHLENDFYWDNPLCLESALSALEQFDDVDFVRFEHLPFTKNQFKEFRELPHDTLGIMKRNVPYQFNLNPHLRRTRFPMTGGFPIRDTSGEHFERVMDKAWIENGHVSSCLFGDNFRHLGVYDEYGNYKDYYAERFTLKRGESTIDPVREFDAFCSNNYYRTLFKEYIDDNRH